MYGKRKVNINWGKLIFFGLLGMIILFLGGFVYFSRGLPNPNQIARVTGYSTEILDRDGKVSLYDIYVDRNRKFVPIEEIPDYLKKATVAIEDKDFYKHGGFDPLAPFRIVKNVLLRQRVIGGSTLTQQLVKQVLLTNERSITRKIRELVLSLRIERQFTKDQILQMYLNESPYGGTSLGVASAAKVYFEKEPGELTLTECVVLAGIPQAPSRYSPYGSNPLAYVARAKEVARRMREDGYLTVEQEKEVVDGLTSVSFVRPGMNIKAPHFVMYVKDQLEQMFGVDLVENGGLRVITSLDWGVQAEAEKIVKEEIDKVATKLSISNGASVIVDTKNGEILSMVGSKDYFDKTIDGEVNVVTRLRQPGSTIKPLVYATAMMNGYTPASVLMDVVTEFPGKDEKTPYIPNNYDGKERGLLHLREALASSINVPAVKLLANVGVKKVLEQGHKMGISTLEPSRENLSRLGLSLALGGGEIKLLEMTGGYGAFGNGGTLVKPVAILKVFDKNGNVLYEQKKVSPERVLDEKAAFLINSMLSDNQARLLTFGPNSYLNMGSRAVAVKTGTTNDMRDNWTIGWTKEVIIGVWVGNNNNAVMKNVASGVSGAAPIWRREMLTILAKYPDKPFDVPKGVSQVEVDKRSGSRSHDGFESYKEWIIDGTLGNDRDTIHKKVNVCKSQNEKLATEAMVASGDFDTKEVLDIHEKDPLTDKNLWQKAIDVWLAGQTDGIYKVPSEYCGDGNGITINIISPSNESRLDGGEVNVRADIVSDRSVEWIDLYIDEVKEDRFNVSTIQKTYKMIDGYHKIKVVVRNVNGTQVEKSVEFSVNKDYAKPTPIPTTTITESPTPIP